MQAKQADPIKPWYILDARDWNNALELNHIPLSRMEEIMNLVAAWKYWRKIDLADGYYNIRIEEDSKQQSIFLTHMGYYESRIMQQG